MSGTILYARISMEGEQGRQGLSSLGADVQLKGVWIRVCGTWHNYVTLGRPWGRQGAGTMGIVSFLFLDFLKYDVLLSLHFIYGRQKYKF